MRPDTARVVASPYGALLKGLTLIAALGSLPFGYDTAVISAAVSATDANPVIPRGLTTRKFAPETKGRTLEASPHLWRHDAAAVAAKVPA